MERSGMRVSLHALVRGLLDKAIIFCMTPDPEPQQPILNFNRQSSVTEPHAYSPIPPNFFELERWVSWVGFKNFIILISQLLHRLWKRFISCPKRWACKVIHNFFVRPAL